MPTAETSHEHEPVFLHAQLRDIVAITELVAAAKAELKDSSKPWKLLDRAEARLQALSMFTSLRLGVTRSENGGR